MPQEATAERLLAAATAGDQAALEQLLLRHYPRLERSLRSRLPGDVVGLIDADDVLQEALVDAFRGIRRASFSGDEAFGAWLGTLVEHRLQDNLRRLRRKKRGGAFRAVRSEPADSSWKELVALLSDHGGTPSHHAARNEAIRAVRVGLAGLPPDQQSAIRHRYLERQTIEATAEVMQRTPGAVRGLLHRAKSSLQDALGRSARWISGR